MSKEKLTPASREPILTLPLLEQKMVYIEPLGIFVEPKKSRVDRARVLAGNISPEEESQFRYVNMEDVITHLSYYQAREYAKRNGKRLLTRREWYLAQKFLNERGVENDFTSGLWEFTDSLVHFSKDAASVREGSKIIKLRSGNYKIRDGKIRKVSLIQKGAYIISVDKDGFPTEFQTEAEITGPVLKPYYQPHIQSGQMGVIICAGDFTNKQLRDLSILVVPLSFKHPYVAFRLCSDSEPTK